jgi:hypothetical protein
MPEACSTASAMVALPDSPEGLLRTTDRPNLPFIHLIEDQFPNARGEAFTTVWAKPESMIGVGHRRKAL